MMKRSKQGEVTSDGGIPSSWSASMGICLEAQGNLRNDNLMKLELVYLCPPCPKVHKPKRSEMHFSLRVIQNATLS